MWHVGEIVTVMDPKTGTTFKAYRIGGYNHADYVPATKKDTATVYALYRNHWTWERKSMLVQLDGQWIAASTNGMPHGQWSKRNNDMNGMLCMHFLYSKTHIHDAQCPLHQACVLSAAKSVGKVSELPPNTGAVVNAGQAVPTVTAVPPAQQAALMDWSEADALWMVGSVATLKEAESGTTFRARRVGGTHNAVFEPEDASQKVIMDKLFASGPVPMQIELGGKWIAASFGLSSTADDVPLDPAAAGAVAAGTVPLNQIAGGDASAAETVVPSATPALDVSPAPTVGGTTGPATFVTDTEATSLYFLNSKSEDSPSVDFVQQMLVLHAAGYSEVLQQTGELMDWQQVDSTWKVGDNTFLQDWQTGALFTVKRVPGSGHAEFTFATEGDEAAFKAQIGGSFGLSQRPMLLKIGDKWVASSTLCTPHEMPDVDGDVFCLHFQHSLLTTSQTEDPASQQSVLLASGQWLGEEGDYGEAIDSEVGPGEEIPDGEAGDADFAATSGVVD